MTIREKLLLRLAQEPSFEGVDDTEKQLVKELKAEMVSEKGGVPTENTEDVKAAAKELAKEMVAMVQTIVAETKKDVTPANRPAANGITVDEDVKTMNKEERFAKYVKALVHKDEKEVERLTAPERIKAMSDTDADGGYLVPDEFRATLIEDVLQTQTIRPFATVVPMAGKYMEIPKLASDVKVYWGTENKSITTTSAELGQMTATPFRLNAIIYTSRELFDDSAISIFEILRRRFTARVADEETRVFINGDGTTQPKGIDAETFRSLSAANALTPDHLTKAYYLLPEGYRNSARWLVNSRVMEHLENSKATLTGQYLYPSLQGDIKTLKGRPVLVTDHVASSKLFFGDLSYYYIFDRQQMTMDVTTEGGETWEKFQVGLRLIERLDGEVALTQAFVEITNTNIH